MVPLPEFFIKSQFGMSLGKSLGLDTTAAAAAAASPSSSDCVSLSGYGSWTTSSDAFGLGSRVCDSYDRTLLCCRVGVMQL